MTRPGKSVLGISAHFHDSAAALVNGAEILAAVQEERFSRKKGDWRFPVNAIKYCRDQLPGEDNIDAIAYYENPAEKLDRIVCNAVANYPRGSLIWPQTLQTINELNSSLPRELLKLQPDPSKIFFTTHHRAHAASAYFPSPFDQAAVLVVDGVGEWNSTTIWNGEGHRLTPVDEIRFPHSLGLFYSAFTQYCGFKVNSGEYKLMGLAPFGDPVLTSKIRNEVIDLRPDGSFRLNLELFGFRTSFSTINPLFEDLFGRPARDESEPLSKHFMDVAASVQAITNEVMTALAATALRKTGKKNLCLAGGVALNCVANSHLLQSSKGLEKIWIQPAAGDAGGALGAALDVAISLSERDDTTASNQRAAMTHSYFGPQYQITQIEHALKRHKLVYEKFDRDADLIDDIAKLLSEGNIVGHFDGRMEFGPRALGNRSILADPRPKDMLSKVNLKIKFREGWRPFAPIILDQFADKYFSGPTQSPYMLLVASIKPEYRVGETLSSLRAKGVFEVEKLQNGVGSKFGATTHVDYTSRLQTVNKKSNRRLAEIIEQFANLTDCPMLLNTSFNVRGEPIVCSPDDAARCFINTDMDVLAIGPFLVRKENQSAEIKARAGKVSFNAD